MVSSIWPTTPHMHWRLLPYVGMDSVRPIGIRYFNVLFILWISRLKSHRFLLTVIDLEMLLNTKDIWKSGSYKLLPSNEDLNKEKVKAAITGSDIDGVLVLRPVKITKEESYQRPAVNIPNFMPTLADTDHPMIRSLSRILWCTSRLTCLQSTASNWSGAGRRRAFTPQT